jgi:hypothetical protein
MGRGSGAAPMPLPARLDSALSRRGVAIVALVLLLAYRLAVGLASEFWSDDELQIYLIGLKFYATGAWPFFGPDLVLTGLDKIHQIPGALQGLLVGLPFHVAPFPEAPFVLLNLLSFAALVFLAWYGSQRVPMLPRWLVYGLALTLPWTLFYSTHVVNPSYVLIGAVLFWVGAVEATVFPDAPRLPKRLADYLQGFGLVWVAQLHLSWTLLVPFAGFAWIARARRGEGLAALGAFALGLATTGSLLLPTLVAYDLADVASTGIAVRFNPLNARDLDSITAKVLSFASYEVPRFIAGHHRARIAWMTSDWRIAPFAFLSVAVGLLQPIAMLLLWFRRKDALAGWTGLKAMAAGTILLTWTAFLFTQREPWALTFYLALPIAFLYSLFCYAWFLKGKGWLALAALVLFSGLVTQTAIARRNLADRSLYLDRHRPARAIAARDHRLLGERRPGTLY